VEFDLFDPGFELGCHSCKLLWCTWLLAKVLLRRGSRSSTRVFNLSDAILQLLGLSTFLHQQLNCLLEGHLRVIITRLVCLTLHRLRTITSNVQRWGRHTQRRIHSVSDVAFILLPLSPERHREPHSRVYEKVTHRGGQAYLSLATCKPKRSEVQNGGQTRTPKGHRLNSARKISSRSTNDNAEHNQIMPLTIPEQIPEQPKPNSKVFQARGREQPESDAYQV
jgi:hypothetical protein